jgi:hypothetical protein
MQVYNDGDQSFACLDSYTCAISFDSFVRRRSLNLLLKYSSETTRLSAGRPSGAKQCSSRTQSRSLAARYKMRFCFAHGKNTRRKSFAKEEVKVFDGQNVVVCCEESERGPAHSASLEERKRSNSLDTFRC